MATLALTFHLGCAHSPSTPNTAPTDEGASSAQTQATNTAPDKPAPLVVVHIANDSAPQSNTPAETSTANPNSSEEACAQIDINKANQDDFVTLPGIGPAKANAIVNYRDRNGRFENIDSLVQVQGIGEVTLGKLRPYLIAGAVVAPPQANLEEVASAEEMPKVNINTGTKEALMTLRGVGPKTADRIIAYRKMHGPFMSVENLVEVKGIGPKSLEKLRRLLEVMVDINTATEEELHILGFKNARKIVKRRDKRGKFKSPKKLRKVPGTDKQLLKRISPILR